MDPDAFWRQTPRLYGLVMQGKTDAMDQERRRDATLARNIAALMRIQKGRLPSVDEMVGAQPAKVQTQQEMKSVFNAWRIKAAEQ